MIRLQIETVDAMTTGLEMARDGNCPSNLGSSPYVFLRDLWIASRRNYFDISQKRQLSGGQSNANHAIEAKIKGSVNQFANFTGCVCVNPMLSR